MSSWMLAQGRSFPSLWVFCFKIKQLALFLLKLAEVGGIPARDWVEYAGHSAKTTVMCFLV